MECNLERIEATRKIWDERNRDTDTPGLVRSLGAVACLVTAIGALLIAKRPGQLRGLPESLRSDWRRFAVLTGIPSLSLAYFGSTIDSMRYDRQARKRSAQIVQIWRDAPDCDVHGHRKPDISAMLAGRIPSRPSTSFFNAPTGRALERIQVGDEPMTVLKELNRQ